MSGRVVLEPPQRGRAEARAKQVRVGNQIEFGAPTLGPVVSGSARPDYRFLLKKRLLTVDSNDFPDDRKGGAWALTLNADKVVNLAVPPPFTIVNTPLVAQITFGCGGISRQFVCDVWNTSLVIPADSVFVEVGWTEISSYSFPGVNDVYPQSIEVAGTLARAQSSSSDGALLTRRVNAASSGALTPIELKIPPFATGWTLMNAAAPGPGSAQWQEAYVRGVGAAYDYVDSLYLDAQKESLAFRSLPSGAVTLTLTPAMSYAQAYILFRIGF